MSAKTIERNEAYINERVLILDDGCWEWQRSITWDGYGQVTGLGEHRAHRLAYRIFKGTIPANRIVCHKCDYRPCCNPDHLFLGTYTDNCQDAVAKGRIDLIKRSEHANSFVKVPEENIQAILDLHLKGERRVEIAKQYKVSRQTIDNIINRNLQEQ